MADFARELNSVNIEDELKQSYLDYAMSVIVSRALPDVRDGLKPVHRRVLFAMHELGNDWNKAYKKSARVIGDVIGKYHPHGDSSVYDALVRMAQDFSMRYVLIDGQGNFGSIDGDPPAAMRYTEVRMAKIAHSLLQDIEKETVDFVPNYDETEMQPSVFPSRVPNLLVNGSSGIAVGMATNIPPHNMGEIINACLAIIDDPNITVEQLMQHVPGPDFPTYGIINGRAGILQAYRTGRGRIYVRARAEIETNDKTGKEAIIVHELPYQVNKARLIEKIAELVKDKKIEGISELRDESDKQGMRIFIGIKRGDSAEVILNNLYSQTQLQTVFGINMVSLVDGIPKLLSLPEMLQCFVKHRRQVVSRRTVYELNKARARAHILEGLSVALTNIDPIIVLIKAAKNPQIAKDELLAKTWGAGEVMGMLERTGAENCRPKGLEAHFGIQKDSSYKLSQEQAQAILDLKLHRLTGLEQEKIFAEFKEIIERIAELMEILADQKVLMQVVKEELQAINEEFSDKRRTEIIDSQIDLNTEDLIAEENMVVTLSSQGYVKSQPLDSYEAQRRGGKGKAAAKVKDEDYISKLLVASTHDTILCFSSHGKVYWLKVYQLPVANRTAKGKPIINLLPLANGETISTILPLREYTAEKTIFMATSQGTVKRVAMNQFQKQRSNGLIAINLDEGDKLIGAAIAESNSDIMLMSDAGKAIRFNVADVRTTGRTARGVRGIRLKDTQRVIALLVLAQEQDISILTATINGYGKRTASAEFARIGRGGQGVIAMQTSERNGKLVAALKVSDADEIMMISDQGTLVRTRVAEISVLSRNTQGVKLINLNQEEHLVAVQGIEELAISEDQPKD